MAALREIRQAEDAVYEIQELRHSSASDHTLQINNLFTAVEARVERIRAILSESKVPTSDGDAEADGPAADAEEDTEAAARAQDAWTGFEKRWVRLKEEMNEDGWLVRFRTTAEQAEAMMDSLAKSAGEMRETVQRHEGGTDQADGPAELVRALKAHLAMRATYASSITKILKMMDRSLSERATKNGEALRRHGDMTARWNGLRHDLSGLEGRARIVLEQVSQAGALRPRKGDMPKTDGIEMLVDALHITENVPSGISGYNTPGSSRTKVQTVQNGSPTAVASSLGPRTSDVHASRATLSPPVAGSRYPSLGSAAHGSGQPTLRRRVSQTSLISTTTAATNTERPRWNASTRVNHSAADAMPGTAKRRLTMTGTGTGSATPSRPSRSGATTPSFAVPAVTPSKIPAPKPRPSASHRLSTNGTATVTPRRSIPGLAVSTTSTRITLSNPSGRNDDIPPVPPLPSRTPSRQTNRSSLASEANAGPPLSYLNRSSVTPHKSRQSLVRGPPSAYRAGSVASPPGSGIPPVPRPSSRMSTGAASVAGSAHGFGHSSHDDLVPFVPSRYDLLDGCVAQILADAAFEHFVARVDAPLKKGQRKGENEEWKGTFVFGAAHERGTPVKMMQLASKDGGKVSKVLARRAGQWVPLKDILEERKEKYDEVF